MRYGSSVFQIEGHALTRNSMGEVAAQTASSNRSFARIIGFLLWESGYLFDCGKILGPGGDWIELGGEGENSF